MTMQPPLPAPRKGWVLYDGSCGFCSDWVPRWRNVLARRGFGIATLQEPWVGQWLQMPQDELLTDVRLLMPSGHHLEGADVYRYTLRRIWWALPLSLLMSAPGLRWLVDQAYRRFAENRYWFSRTCHMPVKTARPDQA
jgi:predicted DCC family thiol-disulfide oxidoreductase YuxK